MYSNLSCTCFAADFLLVALQFFINVRRVSVPEIGTTDKKSSRKIKYKKIPRANDRKDKVAMQNFEFYAPTRMIFEKIPTSRWRKLVKEYGFRRFSFILAVHFVRKERAS